MMSEVEFEKGVDEIKSKFNSMMIEREGLVRRLGQHCENFLKQKNSICEEIKNILREYIEAHLITERLIEMYCEPEWKNKQQSESGKKGGESRSEQRTILAIKRAQNASYVAEAHADIEVPKGTVLVNEWEIESLRKRERKLNDQVGGILKSNNDLKMKVIGLQELVSGLKKTIVEKEAEVKHHKADEKSFKQTVLTDFIPILNDMVKTAHNEKCPSKCKTWQKASRLKLKKL